MKNDVNMQEFVQGLARQRLAHGSELPDRERLRRFMKDLSRTLFPPFGSSGEASKPEQVQDELRKHFETLCALLKPLSSRLPQSFRQTAEAFFESLPGVHRLLCCDAQSIFDGDPAATELEEVYLSYPGFHAVMFYRLAHVLHALEVPLLPRMISEFAHSDTGIDIHPGAQIGEAFCIDHGTGIVVGETAIIGRGVKMYQGVTLGAISVERSLAGKKRHPTIEDQVVLYGQAIVLGGDTVIGAGSIVGGNVWLTKSVPSNSVVFHKSQVGLRNEGEAYMYHI